MNIPNTISLFRITLMPLLLWLAWHGYAKPYIVVLIISFLTDILDGFLARILHQRSRLGAKLDTIADALIYMTMTLAAWWLWPALFAQEAPYILAVITASACLGLLGLYKYHALTSYHTWMIKLAIAFIAAAYIIFFSGGSAWFFRAACILCVLATLEEIAITLLLDKPQSNVISIWHLLKKKRHRSSKT